MMYKVFLPLTTNDLLQHIDGCMHNKSESQKIIYESFYIYAMTICERYTRELEDAMEILNDGFLKVFREVKQFKPAYADVHNSFKGWLRKIMIYTAIDHYRKNHRHQSKQAVWQEQYDSLNTVYNTAPVKFASEEILYAIRQLTPAYRTVLNLFIVEGYSHEEIARMLQISEGTSKSNLAKARVNLQKILLSQREPVRHVV
jgi:RNA polymerase sigma factor (sigma-70 family)